MIISAHPHARPLQAMTPGIAALVAAAAAGERPGEPAVLAAAGGVVTAAPVVGRAILPEPPAPAERGRVPGAYVRAVARPGARFLDATA
jgi:hypothetical protein